MTGAAIESMPAGAASADLLRPFDEQAALDVAAGRRTLFAVRTTPDGADAGSAVLGLGALDLFIHQELRARGLGAAATAQLLERAGDGPLTAWSHVDHPAARTLADRFGFAAARRLLQMRLAELPEAAPEPAPGFEAFRPGADDAEWLALNARVFAWHPEQGGVTQRDLDERMSEPWFRADDFLVARDGAGRMRGFCWLKVDEGSETGTGEIYVIGVAPEASGHGLGRALTIAGLGRLRDRGCTSAELYTEADNAAAVRLYRALGFAETAAHVQYARS
ncbi:MAG: mycothiol synthase [Microbacteriaceae bacterium]|nr:mycothiol synthase [Microbacteriaceae bacterium]MCL2795915.1 mycothiol synthase [Microbacteriaceae bacterium]